MLLTTIVFTPCVIEHNYIERVIKRVIKNISKGAHCAKLFAISYVKFWKRNKSSVVCFFGLFTKTRNEPK